MTHASVELVEAMLGVAPAPSVGFGKGDLILACTRTLAVPGHYHHLVVACSGWPEYGNACEDTEVVTCPACLVAIDAALEGRAVKG